MTQLAITARDNKNLFSNYYLDNQIKNNPEWKKEEHKAAFSEIKKLYDTEKDHIPTLNEKQLEQRFFAPIFKILNHTVEVNEGTEQGEFPDYAFFPDRASLDDAHKKMGNSFYNNAIAIGEVKRWGIELDRFGKDEKDRKRNPSLQIWIYLHDVSPKWGILSNGKIWRLYCKDRRRDDYYEIDLPSLLAKDESKNVEEFKYFYYFFRREAFLTSTDGKIFLDEVLKGSADYAKDIGDDLKDNVYKAMKKVAEGFFSWSQNGLDIQNEAARETVQKCTMLLLYRFLFLLYAEGKGLLDLKKPQYQSSYSFYKLKNEVKEKQNGPLEQRYLGVGTALWAHLKDLFRLINQGSESLGIKDKNVLDVPAYNGGLFDPQKNPELEKWVIGDTYLSEAIDLLSRSRADGGKLDFVDYSTLEIRHLGSIYEGLLEYKLRVAEDEMVVNGGEWVKLEEYNKYRKQKKVFSDFGEFDRVRKGQIYLATDKGDRKATGSYYTPDYIVNYIVKNTVGPVVDEKWKEAEANKKSFVDATLSVKVLDPAMGSGHFLVGSIEFLSEKLLLAVKKDIDNGRFSDESHLTSDWARREVVAHCIYGVDLNLMAVELAKVGLWLTTISKEKPLSFLDHRLKQGNSLIGAKLIDLPWYPDLKDKTKNKENTILQKFEDEVHRPFVDKIVQQLNALSEIDDDTIEHINQKKALFEKLKENKQYLQIKSIADVYTAIYFGNETTEVNKNPKFAYNDLFWALKGDDKEWSRKTYKPWFKKAMEIARDKSFFHWELEFPEIFFEGGAPKENPGWNAVVGNPPYVMNSSQMLSMKNWFQNAFNEIYHGQNDICYYFISQGIRLQKSNGLFSFIVSRYFLESKNAQLLRNYILNNCSIKQLIDFRNNQVFGRINVLTIIYVFEKTPQKLPFKVLLIKDGLEKELPALLYSIDKNPDNINNNILSLQIIPSDIFNSPWNFKKSERTLNFEVNKEQYELLGNLDFISICKGMETGLNSIKDESGREKGVLMLSKEEVVANQIESEVLRKVIKGQDIERFYINYDNRYIIYLKPNDSIDNYPKTNFHLSLYKEGLERRYDFKKGNCTWYSMGNLRNDMVLDQQIERIFVPTYSKKHVFGYDSASNNEFYYGMTDTYIIAKNSKNNVELKYILSILNSHVIQYVHRNIAKLKRDGYYEYTGNILERLPIRRISFTTPPDRRAALVEQVKALYSEFSGAPDSKDLDRINRMDRINESTNPANPVHPVQTAASLSAAPDSLKILEFIGARLSAAPEESDVVHDLLAFLAEQMIEMNKEKNAEIKGFLRWLEGEIGAPVEELTNKTALKEYYDYKYDFETFVKVLSKNKNKLKEGYDPTRREPKDKLEKEYNASLNKLTPLLKRIEVTDGLIDQIVYKLYGLTPEEIAIVEISNKGKQQ